MSTSSFRKMTWGLLAWSLFGISICSAVEASQGQSEAPPAAPAAAITGETPETSPNGTPEGPTDYHGLMSGLTGQIHQIIDEERIKLLSEIDKEFQATLVYLTQERLAATEDMGEGLNRILETLMAERKTTLDELDAMGNRITDRAITAGKQLIDHFFIRLAQFTVALLLLACLAALFFNRVKGRDKK